MSVLQHLIQEIESNGPMPFERFMEKALYGPDGFFGSGKLRSTGAGDFLTSPEVSPHFGRTLGRLVQAEYERLGDPFTVVEAGAGSGSLLRQLLELCDVEALAVERSPAARESLSGFVEVADQVPESFRGVLIANELLDNLPMGLAQMVDGEWRERWVGREGDGLVLVDADPRPDAAAWLDTFSGPVPDGGWVEVQLVARAWVSAAVAAVTEGSVVLIDYGDTAEGLANRRASGTLRTYRSHHLGPDPLAEPGQTDITADVNFSALMDLDDWWFGRQDDFLVNLGLGETLDQLRRTERERSVNGDHLESLRIRSEIVGIETVLHPRGLGDFRVLHSSH